MDPFAYIGGIEPLYSFIVGESNKSAITAVCDFAEKEEGLLYIYGEKGNGKTHLCYTAKDILMDVGAEFHMWNAEDFASCVIGWKSKGGTEEEFYQKYETCDALIFDDIQFWERMPTVQKIFCEFVERFTVAKKRIFVTADRPITEIDWFPGNFPFHQVELFAPDESLKKTVLKEYEYIAGLKLEDEVRDMFLAKAINIRMLQGMFNKMAFILKESPYM